MKVFLGERDLLRILLLRLHKANGFKVGYMNPDWGRQMIEEALPDIFEWVYLPVSGWKKGWKPENAVFPRQRWQVTLARLGLFQGESLFDGIREADNDNS